MLQFISLFHMHACTLHTGGSYGTMCALRTAQQMKTFLWQLSLSVMVFGQNSKTLSARIHSFGTKGRYVSFMFPLFPLDPLQSTWARHKIAECSQLTFHTWQHKRSVWHQSSIMCQWSGWWIEHPDSPPSVRAEETSRLWCTASAAAVCVARGRGGWFGLHHACMDLHTSSHRPAPKSTLNSKHTRSPVFQKLLPIPWQMLRVWSWVSTFYCSTKVSFLLIIFICHFESTVR